jgi:hypothetical protein
VKKTRTFTAPIGSLDPALARELGDEAVRGLALAAAANSSAQIAGLLERAAGSASEALALALAAAIDGNALEALCELLRLGADPNAATPPPARWAEEFPSLGVRALARAAARSKASLAERLLSAGARASGEAGFWSPAAAAAAFWEERREGARGLRRVLSALQKNGAEINGAPSDPAAPLWLCVRPPFKGQSVHPAFWRQEPLSPVLLSLGAAPDAVGPDGESALALVALGGESMELSSFLARKPCLETRDARGDTPVLALARRGLFPAALLAAGADPAARAHDGRGFAGLLAEKAPSLFWTHRRRLDALGLAASFVEPEGEDAMSPCERLLALWSSRHPSHPGVAWVRAQLEAAQISRSLAEEGVAKGQGGLSAGRRL